jgi:signal transduction histidine kinase
MDLSAPRSRAQPGILDSDSVCGTLIRSVEWSKTPVGVPENWPLTLRTTLAMMLHSRHPMFLWWGDELVQFYNDAYLPSFGRGKHPAAMGQRGADCWQEIWPIIWPQIDDVMHRGKSSWNEDQLVPIFRNGRIEDVYWTYGYSPVFDEAGAIAGTLVVCTETTPRVLAERRLKAILALSEKTALANDRTVLLNTVADVLAQHPDDIPFALIFDRNASDASLQLAKCIGLDEHAQSTLGVRLRDYLNAPAAGTVSGAVSFSEDGIEPASYGYVVALAESTAATSNGFVAFGLSPRLPLDDAYRIYLHQFGHGISQGFARLRVEMDRTRLLGEVKAEQERLRNLFAQAPAFMCALEGPTHVFTLANERYYQLIGCRDIIGKPVALAIPEAAGQGFFELLDKVYTSGESYFGYDLPILLARHDLEPPEERFVDFVYQASHRPDGTISGILVHGIDQTERRRAASALQEADRRKDEFLALLAHELRNPLAPIRSYARALERLPPESASVKQAALVINRQVGQMVRLIDDLLDVSRISTGKVELQRSRMELAPVVQQAVEAARPFYEERGVELTITLPGQPVHLHCDAPRLAQIVGNLLHNAAKFTQRGGQVQLTVEREGERANIRVLDNGIGIAANALTSIFTMFTQADTSLERERGGLGIGLALVRSFVELHGGTVEAYSAGPGAGSEFVVRLPILLVEAGASDEGDAAAGRRTRAYRILVVDDNHDGCDSMASLLNLEGHSVRTEYDGASAIATAATFKPEVILMDLGMPKMNGYDACRHIREQAWGKDMLIVAMTGWGQEEDKLRGKQAGFDAHLVKPVDPDELQDMLAEMQGR